MNYRHAFHAGNHTEVFKHALLVLLLEHLRAKDKPFAVMDTHGGLGFYDLAADAAERTGEADAGIRAVWQAPLTLARPYLELVRAVNPDGEVRHYPGSPSLIRAMLRPQDRLITCELHGEDVQLLRARFRNDSQVAVHWRDGYEAMRALVPVKERRGLVFIDPPYEARDEAANAAAAVAAAYRKWPTGIYAIWYPVKDRAKTDPLLDVLTGLDMPKLLQTELALRPEDGTSLVGGGVLVINPPWQFEDKALALGRELLAAFQAPEGNAVARFIG